jgi:lipid A 3-O-deacylase
MSRFRLPLLPLFLLFTLGHVQAQELIPSEPEYGILVLEFENDLFANEDRYYTNGVRASWVTPEPGIPGLLRDLGDLIPFFPGEGELKNSWSLGQSMYTPKDITLEEPDPDDRPYAGWLYLSGGLAEETGARLDRLQLTLGIIGPASLADRTQEFVHDVMGVPKPRGWDTQLGNEVTLMVSYERQWRALMRAAAGGWQVDLTPHWGGTLGTPFTLINSGLTVRAGRDLPHDYGPPRIQPALPGSSSFVPRARRGWYVFAGVDGRAVLYNVFLDGSTFRDSPGVDRNLFVGDAQVGAVVGLGRARVSYTHVFRSPEFRTQPDREDFGALSLSWMF